MKQGEDKLLKVNNGPELQVESVILDIVEALIQEQVRYEDSLKSKSSKGRNSSLANLGLNPEPLIEISDRFDSIKNLKIIQKSTTTALASFPQIFPGCEIICQAPNSAEEQLFSKPSAQNTELVPRCANSAEIGLPEVGVLPSGTLHPEELVLILERQTQVISYSISFISCPICSKAFESANELSSHEQQYHQVFTRKLPSCKENDSPRIACKTVELHNLTKQRSLRVSLENIGKSTHLCTVCGMSIPLQEISSHHREHVKDNEGIPHIASPPNFSDSGGVKVSSRVNPRKEKSRSTPSKSSVRLKMKVQAQTKPHKCRFCDKRFLSASHCKSHENAHSESESMTNEPFPIEKLKAVVDPNAKPRKRGRPPKIKPTPLLRPEESDEVFHENESEGLMCKTCSGATNQCKCLDDGNHPEPFPEVNIDEKCNLDRVPEDPITVELLEVVNETAQLQHEMQLQGMPILKPKLEPIDDGDWSSMDANNSDYGPPELVPEHEDIKMFPKDIFPCKPTLQRETDPVDKLETCQTCGEEILRLNLLEHIRSHLQKGQKHCSLCDYEGHSHKDLRDHLNNHYGLRPYECRFCDKNFCWETGLKKHMVASHEDKIPYLCSQCPLRFATHRERRRHELTHKNISKPGGRNSSANKFNRRMSHTPVPSQSPEQILKAHQRRRSLSSTQSFGSQDSDGIGLEEDDSERERKKRTLFPIPEFVPPCEKEVKSKQSVAHSDSDHKISDLSDPHLTSTLKAGKTCNTSINHTESSESNFASSNSSANSSTTGTPSTEFSDSSSRNRSSKRRRSSKDNPADGDSNGNEDFVSADVFHDKPDHREFEKCKSCNLKIPLEELMNHIKTHLKPQQKKCDICDYEATSSKLLPEHMNIHYVLKPFQCKICKRRFAMKGYLRSHHQQVHESADNRRYVCNFCDKRFVRPCHRKAHEKGVHMRDGSNTLECSPSGKKRSPTKKSLKEKDTNDAGSTQPNKVQPTLTPAACITPPAFSPTVPQSTQNYSMSQTWNQPPNHPTMQFKTSQNKSYSPQQLVQTVPVQSPVKEEPVWAHQQQQVRPNMQPISPHPQYKPHQNLQPNSPQLQQLQQNLYPMSPLQHQQDQQNSHSLTHRQQTVQPISPHQTQQAHQTLQPMSPRRQQQGQQAVLPISGASTTHVSTNHHSVSGNISWSEFQSAAFSHQNNEFDLKGADLNPSLYYNNASHQGQQGQGQYQGQNFNYEENTNGYNYQSFNTSTGINPIEYSYTSSQGQSESWAITGCQTSGVLAPNESIALNYGTYNPAQDINGGCDNSGTDSRWPTVSPYNNPQPPHESPVLHENTYTISRPTNAVVDLWAELRNEELKLFPENGYTSYPQQGGSDIGVHQQTIYQQQNSPTGDVPLLNPARTVPLLPDLLDSSDFGGYTNGYFDGLPEISPNSTYEPSGDGIADSLFDEMPDFGADDSLSTPSEDFDHSTSTTAPCRTCGQSFLKTALVAHVKTHLTKGQKTCDVCQHTFCSTKALSDHLSTHYQFKAHQCLTCFKYFSTKHSLKNHIVCIHEGKREAKCHICSRTFTLVFSLKRHLRLVHKINPKNGLRLAPHEIRPRSQSEKRGKKAANRKGITNQAKQNGGARIARETNVKSFEEEELENRKRKEAQLRIVGNLCRVTLTDIGNNKIHCGFCKETVLVRDFIIHKRNHKDPCHICGKSVGVEEMLQHGTTHVRSLTCEVCQFTARTKTQVWEHYNSHVGVKPVKCSMCGAGFASRSSLRTHYLALHTQVRPHQCRFCERTFVHLSVRRVHEMIHYGTQCPTCDVNFERKKDLMIHMKNNHIEEGHVRRRTKISC